MRSPHLQSVKLRPNRGGRLVERRAEPQAELRTLVGRTRAVRHGLAVPGALARGQRFPEPVCSSPVVLLWGILGTFPVRSAVLSPSGSGGSRVGGEDTRVPGGGASLLSAPRPAQAPASDAAGLEVSCRRRGLAAWPARPSALDPRGLQVPTCPWPRTEGGSRQ